MRQPAWEPGNAGDRERVLEPALVMARGQVLALAPVPAKGRALEWEPEPEQQEPGRALECGPDQAAARWGAERELQALAMEPELELAWEPVLALALARELRVREPERAWGQAPQEPGPVLEQERAPPVQQSPGLPPGRGLAHHGEWVRAREPALGPVRAPGPGQPGAGAGRRRHCRNRARRVSAAVSGLQAPEQPA